MPALTAEQQRIVASKQLNVNRTPDELLALLAGLATADVAAENIARKWGCSAAFTGVIGVIASIIWLNVKKSHPERGAGLLAATIIAVIVLLVLYARAKKGDLSNNFRLTAVPFLAVLREDMNPDGRIHATIDLRDAAIKEKLKSQSDPYREGQYYKVIDRVYVDPWFSGEAEFADGTIVRWQMTDEVLQKQKTKRNPRGKTKTKTKSKRKTTAKVTMTFASKEMIIETSGEDVKGKKRTLRLWKTEKMGDAGLPAYRMLVDLIADGYRRTSIARSA